MRDAAATAPQPIYLKDYRPFGYLVDSVHLTFTLHPTATRVVSRIAFRPNPDAPGPFMLHGRKLNLLSASIDGKDVRPEVTAEGLTCDVPDAPFVWEAEVEIDPQANTALEGLYMSNGMYCTQCEAEGFRKITFYPDRPDVMAPFTVRIEGDLPVMMSNGNPSASGDGWAEWTDPWKKPAYLFALVAGDLKPHRDSFTTDSGNDVDLAIWVREGDLHKCAYAMDALKRSMRWDEQVYGREYDLGVFNIVAVDDFNMGAMENKGLNVFNSAAVLASPDTATDANYARIEGIIAHEYFHNWTGNRITCRDWFQLCLKEGLTVFRDQCFSADMRSAAVKRIEDVEMLRARQFREDAGPLAHPVRPESFIEINNFYTATVYEKGAEIIRMLCLLVGAEGYDAALQLYFERHDGQACTIEDWLKVFEDACDRDLSQFKRWYSQAGTPRLKVEEEWSDGRFTLRFSQSTPPTPGQPDKEPVVLPVAFGLIDAEGRDVMPTQVMEMTEATAEMSFEGLETRPVASILRGFSAPVILEHEMSREDRLLLLAHDSDAFNRWEAGRTLALDALIAMLTEGADPDAGYIDALRELIMSPRLDPAFRALCMALPSRDDVERQLVSLGFTPDPVAIWKARKAMARAMAEALTEELEGLYRAHQVPGPFSPDPVSAANRSLTGAALALFTLTDGGIQAEAQFAGGDSMTLQLGAMSALLGAGMGEHELKVFYTRWKDDRLVLDKWFALQMAHADPATAVETAKELTEHEAFTWKVPNRFRAVIGAFAGTAGFHDPTGAGYDLVADWLIKLDPVNPQTTARMVTVFETWGRYGDERQRLMRGALQRIADTPGLSRDTSEMVARLLG